jgi:hypothetical protein
MLSTDKLEEGMADAIAASREALDIGDGGEVVDQVVVIVTYLLPNGETIAAASPVVRQDHHMGQIALELSGELDVL